VKTFSNPITTIDYLQKNDTDIILSDWLMPVMDGLEFCRRLKMNSKFKDIPLIMITCKSDETDIVTALEVGADDYLIKPFRIKELITRVKKLIRNRDENFQDNFGENLNADKAESNRSKPIQRGSLIIDAENYIARIEGNLMDLTVSEFKLLKAMASKQGKVFTRLQLINILNGDNYLVTDRTVDVKIVSLRKKLGTYHFYIKTIRSVGYKFDENGN
jgi:DNA-binding response OmpR family regulator